MNVHIRNILWQACFYSALLPHWTHTPRATPWWLAITSDYIPVILSCLEAISSNHSLSVCHAVITYIQGSLHKFWQLFFLPKNVAMWEMEYMLDCMLHVLVKVIIRWGIFTGPTGRRQANDTLLNHGFIILLCHTEWTWNRELRE